jgi:hypothetical protein
MSNLKRLIKGEPLVHKKFVPPTEEELYWHMHKEGMRRFGSECKHEHKKNGRCTNCLRKVI